MPPDQQNDLSYSQYGVFWLYNWFQADNNMNIFYLMNGNIFNYSLASEQYSWSCGWDCSHTAYAIPPAPPGNISTITGEPIFVQSYINAYNTAFNQSTPGFSGIYQEALNNYQYFTYYDVNSNFIPGTFGYNEQYNGQSNITIGPLQDEANLYAGIPYLFISTGSGGGSGFMYLDWIIVTYGVPYVVSVS
jgi:hypothetical protein